MAGHERPRAGSVSLHRGFDVPNSGTWQLIDLAQDSEVATTDADILREYLRMPESDRLAIRNGEASLLMPIRSLINRVPRIEDENLLAACLENGFQRLCTTLSAGRCSRHAVLKRLKRLARLIPELAMFLTPNIYKRTMHGSGEKSKSR